MLTDINIFDIKKRHSPPSISYTKNIKMEDNTELLKSATEVLKVNDRGEWTAPAAHLYPHQWLWDSCFVAIGLRHIDINRAQIELKSLLRGQWHNGMLPHMIFASSHGHHRDWQIWRSQISPDSPEKVHTSGLTQPPMIAEAVVKVGMRMKLPERRIWYAKMYPSLLRYHRWLYRERDPLGSGLVISIHPYETGMDNSPPWIAALRAGGMPWWVSAAEKIRAETVINLVRRDTRFIPPGQRMSSIEALAYVATLSRLRRQAYDSKTILSKPRFAIADLAFNCILIRANDHLKAIAKSLGKQLPEDLSMAITKSRQAIDTMWDEQSGLFFNLDAKTQQLIMEPSVATLLPLYSGAISKDKATRLVEIMKRRRKFSPSFPLPSVPLDSKYYDATRYWQGPTWVNMNWLVIDGLKRYGFAAEAEVLKQRTIDMVDKVGCSEYFNPANGNPEGADNFSWTAALTIDLIKS